MGVVPCRSFTPFPFVWRTGYIRWCCATAPTYHMPYTGSVEKAQRVLLRYDTHFAAPRPPAHLPHAILSSQMDGSGYGLLIIPRLRPRCAAHRATPPRCAHLRKTPRTLRTRTPAPPTLLLCTDLPHHCCLLLHYAHTTTCLVTVPTLAAFTDLRWIAGLVPAVTERYVRRRSHWFTSPHCSSSPTGAFAFPRYYG